MRDRLLIFAGLLVFVGLVTYPMWYGIAAKTTTAGPQVTLPAGQKTCVAPAAYMRAAHMDLLIAWREGKVREHQRHYTSYDGKTYTVSLTKTCLGECHGSHEQFCDRCHKYAAVSGPNCWDCHTDPALKTAAALRSAQSGAPASALGGAR
jgi:hypothetical protein